MAKQKKKTENKPKKRSAFTTIFMIIFSLGMIMVFQLGFIFFLMAMLPTVVAYYIDNSPEQSTFHTVFACNLAGVLPFLGRMLDNSGAGESSAVIMTNAFNWLTVYAAAGLGWVLVFSVPIAAEFFIRNLHRRQIARLERVQARITEEWGEEIEEIKTPGRAGR